MNKVKKGFFEAMLLAVAAGVILFAGWAMARTYDANKAYTPTNLIRLHIIGNSDEPEDQEVKLKVRDALMSTFGGRLLNVNDTKEAEKLISDLLPEIQSTALGCLDEWGFSYKVSAKLRTVFFPDKYYQTASNETVFLPEGPYKALQVVLGSGKGQNWWCVMYPPLCYVDIVRKNIGRDDTDVTGVQECLGGADSVFIADEDSLAELPLEIRFLALDIIKKGKELLPAFFASLANMIHFNMLPAIIEK